VFATQLRSSTATTALPHTWERYAKGRTIVGVDEAQNEFKTAGKTGGTKDLPLPTVGWAGTGNAGGYFLDIDKMSKAGSKGRGWDVKDGNEIKPAVTKSDGYDKLQPYITTYIWRRIA